MTRCWRSQGVAWSRLQFLWQRFLWNFHPFGPILWFIQAEAQFENERITASHTKFTHCVAALPQDVASRLLDLVWAPPAEPYEALRRRLIQMYSLNDFRRYQALQSLPLLSDQCPTELMDKMLILLFEDKGIESLEQNQIFKP